MRSPRSGPSRCSWISPTWTTRRSLGRGAALDDYAALGAEGRVLVGASMSLSKSMTLYGARCGALAFPWAGDPALQAALTQSCRGTWSNCAKAPQALLLRLEKDGKAQARLAAEHRHWSEVLAARAAALDEALAAEGMAALHWTGGFFVCVPVADPDGACLRMKGEGVFTVPLPEGLRVGLCGLRAAEAPRSRRPCPGPEPLDDSGLERLLSCCILIGRGRITQR